LILPPVSSSDVKGSQTPRLHVAPTYGKTYGDIAADWAASLKGLNGAKGINLDPWQRSVLDDWLAIDDDGKWVCRTCGLAVPRQNGKNGTLEVREAFGVVALGERILHTAHEVKTNKKHFKRLKWWFGEKVDDPRARFPELNKLVIEVRRVNGEEGIYLANGGYIEFATRTTSAAKGFTGDTVIYDEAQEMNEDHLDAINAIVSASPLGNPQRVYTGTPPNPTKSVDVFRRIRRTALGDEPGARCWAEWSAAGLLGVDFQVDDRGLWGLTNPSLGGRIQVSTVEDELGDLSPQGFARERLGWWGPDDGGADEVIPLGDWAGAVSQGPPDGDRPTAMAIDMSHDRLAAVAACWADGGRSHVELVALDYATDTLQVVETVARMARHMVPVVIDQWSPAAALAGPLSQRRVKVKVTSSGSEMARACGLFVDDLTAGRMTHADQAQLDDAVAGAKRRRIGDAGGWGLDRRDPDQNIAPLVAVVLARYGAALTRLASGQTSRNRSHGRRAHADSARGSGNPTAD